MATLSAARIPYAVVEEEGSWVVRVSPAMATRAQAELAAYEMANLGWPPPDPGVDPGPADPALLPLDLIPVVLLVLWYRYTGPCTQGSVFGVLGAYTSVGVADGELWRAVTALTLHRDVPHLLGNAACLYAFGRAFSREMGVGVAWFLVLATGTAGGLFAHVITSTPRSVVGASGAAFAVVGCLVVRQIARHYRTHGLLWRLWCRTWLPVGAGLGILAFLGASPGSDLVGHSTGFLAGAVAGAFLLVDPRKPRSWVQWAAGVAALFTLVMAWTLAYWGRV